ncbi:sulfotransferase [Sphingopyxis sp. YF1]|uniref:sulfotransferase family protein n=1 Tax=Sphingopyxis sp. YF1 TaxID=2482763 RepID=UPI001F609C36|nr:sulfotransferase [Sphingopyxis sp. YF1]UNU43674.1 sulfotransferase [Sphingopyxis sp. YF1]
MSDAYASALAGFAAPLAAAALLAEAEARTGLSDWGGRRWGEDRFRHDFALLCDEIEASAALTATGRSRTHSRLMTMLVSRLGYLDARKAAKGADAERIAAPLIGSGMPRAGTTFLHGLFARDPANRAVPAWQAAMPAPLADGGDRAALYARILAFQGMTAPDVTAIHPFGSELPEECIFLQEGNLGSLYGVYWNVPRYQAAIAGKMPSAFAWQVGVMQYLQAGGPPRRWALKGPGHLFAWRELLIAFPDARLYVNHRDPGKVIPSIASLFARLRALFSDDAVDPAAIGAQQLAAWQHATGEYAAWRDCEGVEACVSDVRFTDLVTDPLATVARVYDELGIGFTADARDAMARHLETDPHAAAPKRAYRLADYGLDEAAIEAAFAPYIERFSIEREKRQ